MRFKRLQDWLSWQQTLHSQKIELGLGRIAEVAGLLDVLHPAHPVITVAGTNGKGSIVAILESIYHQAGYRVGSYTSPHLLRYNERIRVGQENIDDETLCKVFDLVDRARGEARLSYFEFGTLAAMQIFNDAKLDVAIYEVGLGGRLDAVNIIDADLGIVSSIGIDHVQWLGSTRESIGLEKAGIFRAHRPAVCGDEDPPATLVKYAQKLGTELYLIDRDYFYRCNEGHTWSFCSSGLTWDDLPMPSLYGKVQVSNAAAALMGVSAIDEKLPVTRQNVEQGLSGIHLPGRFQHISGPCEIVLDVAHNLDSAKVLDKNLQSLPRASRTYAVFAVLADKDVDGIINAIKGHIDEWFISYLPSERPLHYNELREIIKKNCTDCIVHTHPCVSEAYSAARRKADDAARIVVFGSFLTVAEVLNLEV